MKNPMALAWLLAVLALPAAAQDEAPAASDAAPAAEEAPPAADTAPAEAITENAVVIDDGSGGEPSAAEAVTGGESMDATASTDEAPAEDTASSDEGSSDSPAEPREGLKLYVGLEYDQTTVDINDEGLQDAVGGSRFDSDFYKLRLGVRMFEAVGVEFHAGFPANDSSDDKLETKQFYGLYLVPTGVLLDTIEVSARLGYAYTEIKSDAGKQDADGASFGVAFELPLRLLGEGMPNLRLGAGGTVYQEDRDARVFGWHGGIRYDFTL